MDKLICEKCGSVNVESGLINTSIGFVFTPSTKIKLQPKQALACDICKDCGHIQNLHVTNPQNL